MQIIPKIIYFVGTHGTGKTHTLNELDRQYNLGGLGSSHLIDGIPRGNLYKFNPIIAPSEVPREAKQYSILFEYLRRLGQTSEQLLGLTTYSTNNAMRFLGYASADNLNSACLAILQSIAEFEKIIAHAIFYFPIEVPLEKDEHRPDSVKYQKEVDKAILHYLNVIRVSPITVEGSIQDKVKFIVKELGIEALREMYSK